MKILIAPNPFKESLTSFQAAEAIERGVRRACPRARVRCVPLGDGGEGTGEVFTHALHGRFLRTRVRGPLGVSTLARWGWVPQKRLALLEMAEAAGLGLVARGRRNPLRTSTYGVGQLVLAALKRGCREIILGVG